MKYCPQCEAEYREEIELCADCEVALIPEGEFLSRKSLEEQERARLEKDGFVTLKVAENAFEADRIRAALEQEGIPVVVRTFQDTAFDGLFLAQKGWARLQVPESCKARADQIIADLSRVFPEASGAGETKDAEAGESQREHSGKKP